ncbi:uncharacterized protein BDR25DRAFT_305042 [Lindgomyces ingoldianus]|uniref:Uncharacterized protein n=1 Tax=Lindgomyces ingoldianus TaxID=673940 RepID=A0ACB6QMU4_9PLEO|nr:uncharacterized protein BDR25DRAFT_305042 [Lindgomyces ingoldianus]KAF2468349.1 hypothetical protein BDR25DRAFT_305042 [Lindgomyces ingoldianus]
MPNPNSTSSRERKILREYNITDVYKKIIPEGNHLFIKCGDSMTQDLLPELANICDFINPRLDSGSVLVHCDRGVSRSATACDLATALAFVGEKRKIKPNDNFKEQLEVWGAVRGNVWAAPGVPKAEYAVYLAKRTKRLQEARMTRNKPIGITSL